MEKNTKRGNLWPVLHTKCYADDQINSNEMDEECSSMGKRRCSYKVLVGGLEGKRPLGIPRHRWEGNIKVSKCICWLFIYFRLKWIFKKWDGEHGLD